MYKRSENRASEAAGVGVWVVGWIALSRPMRSMEGGEGRVVERSLSSAEERGRDAAEWRPAYR